MTLNERALDWSAVALDDAALILNEQDRRLSDEARRIAFTLLEQAVELGRGLRVVRDRVPDGEWGQWCSDNLTFTQKKASNYIRLAHYREHLPDDLSGLTIDAALETLRSLPDASSRGQPAYPDYIRVEALRLRSLGMSQTAVADELGISHTAVYAWERSPDEIRRANRQRAKKARDARRALIKAERDRARLAAAKAAGVDELFSTYRRFAQLHDRTLLDADPSIRPDLRRMRNLLDEYDAHITKILDA